MFAYIEKFSYLCNIEKNMLNVNKMIMKTINYNKLPKGLTQHPGLNVFEGKKYVYILTHTIYTRQEDRLWIVTCERYHEYHDLTLGDQLSKQEISEIAKEAHCSIESIRDEVSVTAAEQYIRYNEPDAISINV